MKHFETLEQLHEEWEVNGACAEGVEFNHSCKTLQEVFETCPEQFRVWRIIHGYLQFVEHCPWNELSGYRLSTVLSVYPEFIARTNARQLKGYHWSDLIAEQPQLSKYCPFETLDNWDWVHLLTKAPQFVDQCDCKRLNGYQMSKLLQEQPHFSSRCNLDILEGADWVDLLMIRPQFIDVCRFDTFNGMHWLRILQRLPSKLNSNKQVMLNLFRGLGWEDALQELIRKAQAGDMVWRDMSVASVERLLNEHWVYFLRKLPEKFKDARAFHTFEDATWGYVLVGFPYLIQLCDAQLLSHEALILAARAQPDLASFTTDEKVIEAIMRVKDQLFREFKLPISAYKI